MKPGLIIITVFLFSSIVCGVECPDGFAWRRNSGVGCMQADCERAGGSYSYTGSCICRDKKPCSEAVDYTGFDKKNCHPFCPVSRLTACIERHNRCPGEEPTLGFCEGYCRDFFGVHVKAQVSGGQCDCDCLDGYVDKDGLCVPTKETCDRKCNEYHGQLETEAPAVGRQAGTGCDCKCSQGYVPDEKLVCKKAADCETYCREKHGPNAQGGGSHPDCKCGCKDGYSFKRFSVEDGLPMDVCEENRVEREDSGEVGNYSAKIIAIKCLEKGGPLPKITVTRPGVGTVGGYVGMRLREGDEVSIVSVTCNNPIIVFQWGQVKARLKLTDVVYYDMRIGGNAVETGWPSLGSRLKSEGWSVGWQVITNLPPKIAKLLGRGSLILGPLGELANPSGFQGVSKVYVESDFFIKQDRNGIVFYTLSGSPIVEVGGRNQSVGPGMKYMVRDSGNVLKEYTAGEITGLIEEFKDFPECDVLQETDDEGVCRCMYGLEMNTFGECVIEGKPGLACMPLLLPLAGLFCTLVVRVSF